MEISGEEREEVEGGAAYPGVGDEDVVFASNVDAIGLGVDGVGYGAQSGEREEEDGGKLHSGCLGVVMAKRTRRIVLRMCFCKYDESVKKRHVVFLSKYYQSQTAHMILYRLDELSPCYEGSGSGFRTSL